MTLIHEERREGSTISGKYLLEQRLGAGAVGEVFRARNVLLARDVAIKLLRREHARNAEIVDRFLREARAASCVQHPHIVDVLDVGTDGGTPYIVQELLLGEDLGALLARKGGRITADVAVTLMLPAIDGVAAAHARGVVHRDLKPENVFLSRTPDGVVPKVLDFGISKMPASDARATLAGSVFGTPGYMAPEQVMSFASADARADVWSLGVMLYELVSGRLPWDFTEPQALLVAVCTTPPRALQDVVPEAPPELCDIVSRCLAREPAGRFSSAAALSVALRAASDGPAKVARLQFVAMSLPPPAPVSPPSAAPMPLVRARASVMKPSHISVAKLALPSAADEAPWMLDLDADSSTTGTSREREITLEGRVSDIADIRPAKPRTRRVFPLVAATLATLALASVAVRQVSPRAPHVTARPHASAVSDVVSTPVVVSTPTAAPSPVAAPAPVAPAIATTPAAEPTVQARPEAEATPQAPRAPSRPHASAGPRRDEETATTETATTEQAPAASPSELMASVHRAEVQNMSQSVTCIERARTTDPDLAGRLSVRLMIAPSGRVRSADPVATGPMLPLARCLARAMSSWTLDRSGGETDAVITWPFELGVR